MLQQSLHDASAPTGLSGPPLWLLAVLFFGLGDMSTTTVGIFTAGIAEAGPLTVLLVKQHGLGAVLLLKLVIIGGAYVAWRLLPRPQRVGIPLGLALVGILVTIWNIRVLALGFLS